MWCWNFLWRRNLFVWEESLLRNLLELLSSKTLVAGVEVSWIWQGKDNHPYSMKSTYQRITELEGRQVLDFYKLLWDRRIPLKVAAFYWRASLDRIPSAVNLHSRGIVHPNGSILCRFCSCNNETTTHLLLHCNFSYSVWMFVYN